jgi:hypothetical protein
MAGTTITALLTHHHFTPGRFETPSYGDAKTCRSPYRGIAVAMNNRQSTRAVEVVRAAQRS